MRKRQINAALFWRRHASRLKNARIGRKPRGLIASKRMKVFSTRGQTGPIPKKHARDWIISGTRMKARGCALSVWTRSVDTRIFCVLIRARHSPPMHAGVLMSIAAKTIGLGIARVDVTKCGSTSATSTTSPRGITATMLSAAFINCVPMIGTPGIAQFAAIRSMATTTTSRRSVTVNSVIAPSAASAHYVRRRPTRRHNRRQSPNHQHRLRHHRRAHVRVTRISRHHQW